ncbi:hypothetical protein [Streptomyces albogriseolus]|uniref:hypothetical protein n=1 Tax=Streptomyces albogriseolus TaxID=1887 RepID=UPI003830AD97
MSTAALSDVPRSAVRLNNPLMHHPGLGCVARAPPLAGRQPGQQASVDAVDSPRQVNASFKFQEIKHT